MSEPTSTEVLKEFWDKFIKREDVEKAKIMVTYTTFRLSLETANYSKPRKPRANALTMADKED